MKNSNFEAIESQIKNMAEDYYLDNFDFDDYISSDNFLINSMLDNFNDILTYHKPNLLADFGDTLKPKNKEKLANWLEDQDILFLFEHELKLEKARSYYQGKNSFFVYSFDEFEQELYDQSFKGLTQDQIDYLESEYDCHISKNSDKEFYFFFSGFEVTLPKAAILSAYLEDQRANR